MTRREFLKTFGVTAAAVTFCATPYSLAEEAAYRDEVEGKSAIAVADKMLLRVGDVFTIDGYFAINPVTRKSTEHLQQFVVTAVEAGKISMIPRIETARDGGQPIGGYYWPKGYGFKEMA